MGTAMVTTSDKFVKNCAMYFREDKKEKKRKGPRAAITKKLEFPFL